jgi:uncharacterized protein YecE (DUF72 family)
VVRIGTSGYSYPAWRGSFYPAKLSTRKMLAFYAERFSTVEINATFYRMPKASVLAGWRAQVPAGFVFALKAPRRITHARRLRDVAEPVQAFCEVALTLGDHLGPILFQLPPTAARDTDRLGALLAGLPPGLRVAFEFRHPSWFADEVYALLRRHDVALCVADTEDGTTPDIATAGWGYVRLRDAGYTGAALGRWAVRLRRPGWTDAFVFFKHEETGRGPALARRLQARRELD